jgi:AraC-like DNA-binding protein
LDRKRKASSLKATAKRPAPGAGGLVRLGPLLSIPALLLEFGCDPDPLIRGAGLRLSLFDDPDTEIPYLAASKLLARCVEATGCEHFGLLMGERAPPSALGVAGFLLRTAPDVGTGLAELVQYLDLHDQGGTPSLQDRGRVTLLGYAIHAPDAVATEQICDASIAIAANIMRSLCGSHWNPLEVLLSRRPPADDGPYRRFFRAPIRFDAEQSAVVFRSQFLRQRPPAADALMHQYFEKEAQKLHARRTTTLSGELRPLLRNLLATQRLSAADAARQLGIHERTLNRRLVAEGTTYHRELDDIRKNAAEQLLATTSMPLKEIAAAAGYGDASAFSRAFKRWCGTTPAEWRTKNGQA